MESRYVWQWMPQEIEVQLEPRVETDCPSPYEEYIQEQLGE